MLVRARSIAAGLAVAAGTRAHLARAPSGYRVSARAPRDPERLSTVLRALGLADRFGHSTRDGGMLWCEVDDRPPPGG
ncbi:hypothetical protein OG871_09650 [Kitasatospora sp. NBC_00374]|uniref:hypothetical protein n=1 Tax=Kitasatospora sp. NBC_00374 TaxID=2975964 RepID=UPI003244850B